LITSSLQNNILTEELQLGEQLNHCVHQKRRADFSLMLSMLTDDVRAFSEFNLPQTSFIEKAQDEVLLRKRFDLPLPARLALTALDEINEFSQAQLVVNQQVSDIHLSEAIRSKPLAFRDNKDHIDNQVVTNTSLHCQQRLQNKKEYLLANKLGFNVNEWLKSVQSTVVKSPLMETVA